MSGYIFNQAQFEALSRVVEREIRAEKERVADRKAEKNRSDRLQCAELKKQIEGAMATRYEKGEYIPSYLGVSQGALDILRKSFDIGFASSNKDDDVLLDRIVTTYGELRVEVDDELAFNEFVLGNSELYKWCVVI